MVFDGSISATVANTFEQTVRGAVQSNVNSLICQQINEAQTEVTDMLGKVYEQIETFLPSNSSWSDDDVDPLQTSIVIPNNITLVDFANNTAIGLLVTQMNSFLYIGIDSVDSSNTGINSFIRSNFLLLTEDTTTTDDESHYYYNVPVDQFFTDSVVLKTEDRLSKSQININSMRIFGLDTFTEFYPPSPIAPQVLQSSFVLTQIRIIADFTVIMQPSTLSTSLLVAGNNSGPVTENITVSFDIENIEAIVSFFVAISMDNLSDIQLGSILHSNQISPCLLQAVQGAEVTQLIINVGNITTPIVTGLISTGLDRVLANATEAAFHALREWILKSTKGFFHKTARPSVNDAIRKFLSRKERCTAPTFDGQEKFVDFRDLLLPPEKAVAAGATGTSPYGDVGAKLMQLVEDYLVAGNPKTGLSLMNENLIGPLTLSQSNITGSILFKRDFINNSFKIDVEGLKANVRVRVFNARINHLNSTNATTLLSPSVSDAYQLDNELTLGISEEPLEFETRILLKITTDNTNVDNEFIFKIELDAAQIKAAIMAMVDTKSLLTFPLRDIKNPHCWLSTIPPPQLDAFGLRLKNATTVTASVPNFSASVQSASFGVNCISCTSPGLDELDKELRTENGVQETTKLFNMVTQKLGQIIKTTFLQVQIDRLLNEAPMRCPHLAAYNSSFTQMQYEQLKAPKYADNSGGFFLAVVITIGVFIGFVMMLMLTANFFVSRKHRKWLLSLSIKELKYVHMQQAREENLHRRLNKSTSAMYKSSDVPMIARYVIPIVVLVNIALFINGHLSLGATVNIDIILQGQKISINNFFDFSIAHSIKDMWDGGARVLAVLVCILSGVWPYVKQISVLIMWFIPPERASVQFRGKFFHWLDTLGKWSVIDIYVLVFTMIAFRLSIESPASQASFLSSLYTVDVMIIPKWGLYAMMIAQLVSHISSHFLLHYHRKILDAGLRRELDAELSQGTRDLMVVPSGKAENPPVGRVRSGYEDDTKICALRHSLFEVNFTNKKKNMAVRSWVDFALVLIGLIAATLFVLGCLFPSFQLYTLGLVGIAAEIGEAGDNIQHYSVFRAVSTLIDLAKYLGTLGDWVGLVSLSILVIFSTFLVPLLQVSSTLLLWFIPMQPQSSKRKKFLLLIEIMQAWQYVEVYLVALLIATWQIGGISEFFFNDLVGGSVDGVLGSMVYYGMLSPENAQMFYVVSKMECGAYVLLAGSLFLRLINKIIMLAEKQQREQVLREIRDNDKIGKQMRAQIDEAGDSIDNYREMIDEIKCTPMQFTDYFKMLLVTSSSMHLAEQKQKPFAPHFRQNLTLSSDSLVLSPVELDYSQDDLMVSSLSSFDYDTSTSVSLDLVRPLGLLSRPNEKVEVASFGE
jgi:hypothetical protein